jgi:amino-acid N-acetyltransferase
MAIDDNVVGCVALHAYPAEGCAEVACLHVKQSHGGRGYGMELVEHAEAMARERGIARVFALTNRAADFFNKRLGYSPATVADLPPARRQQFEASGRDSLVFSRVLEATATELELRS